jgi:hypothetical protein
MKFGEKGNQAENIVYRMRLEFLDTNQIIIAMSLESTKEPTTVNTRAAGL